MLLPSFTLVSLYIFYAIVSNLQILILSATIGPSDTRKITNYSDPFLRHDFSNELDDDEIEMFTNNHKTTDSQQHPTSAWVPGSHSRHYTNHYAQQQSNSLANQRPQSSLMNPLGFYAKFQHPHQQYHQQHQSQQHNAPNIFANNYLQSLLHNKPQSAHSQSSSSKLSSTSGPAPLYGLILPKLHDNANMGSLYGANHHPKTTTTTSSTASRTSTTTKASNFEQTMSTHLSYNNVDNEIYIDSNLFNSYLHKPYYNHQMQHYYQSFITSSEPISTTTTIMTFPTPPPTTTTTTTTTASNSPVLYYQDQNFESHSVSGSQMPDQSIGSLPGSSTCGRQQVSNREPRIVGGNISYEGEFPWAVSIQRHGNHHCGGVIAGRRWILTAAHCVRSQMLGNLVVRTGGNTLTRSSNNVNSHLERDYSVDQIIMHDDFTRYDNLTSNQLKLSASTTNNADIALIRLKHDIRWNELAWPVCFPNKDAGNFSGHDAIVIGWGKLNEKSEDFSNELQKVKLTIIDNKVCQNWFRQAGREMPIDDRIICAGYKSGGKDACHGDSGGPLLSKINGQYVVVGVVSTGIGCARPLLPGLYSRVSSYMNWIEKYIVE